ncbi:molybdate ABC transporter permease subunit [Uliginosibacterium sp. TH139]|uniref:molybdate ABC transporter permease subunit n=1 Tax=Uliginosibacterium sp. TH139 TaxID=2067453 RepID=UPI000C7E76DB|nr:molybdate ABC transporter permease subunit [Uliginosibacterium sp. TH139]PLK48218.1 molybdate ABC transporter permease subunit [Uliginosibacterium sp. TH139]
MQDLFAAVLPTLTDPAVRHAVWLTAEVAGLTLLLHAAAGVLLGYALSCKGWPGRNWLDVAVTLPLVFPPVALGFLLLLLFGREGGFGRWLLACCGQTLVFSLSGVVLAAFVAGLPLVVKPVQAAMESLSARLGEVARTLGKREWEIACFVLLPNVKRALVTGLVLGLGRSLGEVGITLMLGGNIIGRTNTVSLEIYNAVFAGEYPRAMVLTLLLGALSVLVFVGLRRMGAQ